MRLVKPDEPVWEYAYRDNFLVIPITHYVRKDGHLVMQGDLAKEAEARHPGLAKRWGYLVKAGVEYPVHRNKDFNLIGLKVRDSHLSKFEEETITTSLLYLNDKSTSNMNYVFYLDGFLGGNRFKSLHEELLTSDRIIVFSSDAHDEELD